MTIGICECGCGQSTRVADQTRVDLGWVKGRPIRFVHGHHGRKSNRWSSIDLGFSTPCRIWLLSVDRDGYGSTVLNGEFRRSHVVQWEEIFGPVPDGLVLDHLCHDPDICVGGFSCLHRRCGEVTHLKPVPWIENSRRRITVKLSIEKAVEIRNRHASGTTIKELAQEYGVARATISKTIRGERWVS